MARGRTFKWALKHLMLNRACARLLWNGDAIVETQRPDPHCANTEPYLYMSTSDGKRVPWAPNQSDLFALDWTRIRDGNPFDDDDDDDED